MTTDIRPRERDQILQALKAGVVPRAGLRHVQVGRAREIAETINDVARIDAGGTAFRVIVGNFGSGKTFYLSLARQIGLEKRLVTISADLGPDRRLHASGGQARSLYAELIRNMATRTKPEGGALQSLLERFAGEIAAAAKESGQSLDRQVAEKLDPLKELVCGFDFAAVLTRYVLALDSGDDATRDAALRWLRGEYGTRTEAKNALGVRGIVDDANVWDHLKLIARLVVLAGYQGLLVLLDETVNLYKLPSAQARNANYEELLRILNDLLQGGAEHVGVMLGATPELLMDSRRGLYSYEALRSRLAENSFAKAGLVDLAGPVIRLHNLTPEDFHVLLTRIRGIFEACGQAPVLPDAAIPAFMAHCQARIGAAYFQTPRNSIRAFIDLLDVLRQNPETSWDQLLPAVEIAAERPDLEPEEEAEADAGRTTRGAPAQGASKPELPLAAASEHAGETILDAAAADEASDPDDDLVNLRL